MLAFLLLLNTKTSRHDENSASYEIVGKEMRISGDGIITSRAVAAALASGGLDRDKLQAVVINEGITVIDKESFYQCKGLDAVTFPKSLVEIKESAFCNSRRLAEIKLPAVRSIANFAFQSCKRLTYVTLPDTLTYIGESAFDNCIAIASIKIPGSVSYLGPFAYSNSQYCEELIFGEGSKLSRILKWTFGQLFKVTEINIPDSVIDIDEGAFYNCNSLKTIKLSANIVDIGKTVFSYCNSLTEFVVDPANKHYRSDGGVLLSRDGVLLQYPGNKPGSYKIPSFVKRIDTQAFTGTQISEFDYEVGSKLEDVGEGFLMCPNLTKIRLPPSIKDLGDGAFDLNDQLESFEYCSIAVPTGIDMFKENEKLKFISVSENYPSDTFAGLPVVRNATCLALQGLNKETGSDYESSRNLIIIISISLLSVFAVTTVVIFVVITRNNDKELKLNEEALINQEE